MKTEKQPKQETLEEAAERFLKNGAKEFKTAKQVLIEFAKWQQEQEQNNENSWFNEYQEVEDYIIKRIGDKFLEATPEKYNTASEATIALLENNWQKEQDKNLYSEEEVYSLLLKHQSTYRSHVRKGNDWSFDIKKWFEQFKKK